MSPIPTSRMSGTSMPESASGGRRISAAARMVLVEVMRKSKVNPLPVVFQHISDLLEQIVFNAKMFVRDQRQKRSENVAVTEDAEAPLLHIAETFDVDERTGRNVTLEYAAPEDQLVQQFEAVRVVALKQAVMKRDSNGVEAGAVQERDVITRDVALTVFLPECGRPFRSKQLQHQRADLTGRLRATVE